MLRLVTYLRNKTMAVPESIVNSLKIAFQSSSKTSLCGKKRQFNIDFIASLDREGLQYGNKERLMLIYESPSGQKVYIQYPGKESRREGREARPWDFRPKVQLSSGQFLEDYDFGKIWFSVEKLSVDGDISEEELLLIAILFYRLAFMTNHKKTDGEFRFITKDILNKEILEENYSRCSLFLPNLDEIAPALNYLNGFVETICGGMTFDTFIMFNDLLALNEDAKYYYRLKHVKEKNGWIGDVGRINNLLTFISIIGLITKKIHLSPFLQQMQFGVSPARRALLKDILNSYILE